MNRPTLSLCLFTEGGASGFLNAVIPTMLDTVCASGGEVILSGDLSGVAIVADLRLIAAEEDARNQRRGRMRNLSIASARGSLIISAEAASILSPPDWPERLLEWCRPIAERAPYLFGIRTVGSDGDRLWDWIRVDSRNRVSLVDYGEQVGGLALGASFLGMSRPAWDLLGGFSDEGVGAGEEIEFSLKAGREAKMPIVFCDALEAVRIHGPTPAHDAPRSAPSREGPR